MAKKKLKRRENYEKENRRDKRQKKIRIKIVEKGEKFQKKNLGRRAKKFRKKSQLNSKKGGKFQKQKSWVAKFRQNNL